MARRQINQLDMPAGKKGVGADEQGIGAIAPKSLEGGFDLVAGGGLEDVDLQPEARAAGSTSLMVVSAFAVLAGLTSTATRTAPGTSSRNSSSRLATSSPLRKLIPVRLPPGRARLATRPSLTGSSGARKIMGIDVVAALVANATARPNAAITETWRRTSSATIAGSRSFWPSTQRYAISRFRLQRSRFRRDPVRMHSGSAQPAQLTAG